MNKFIKLRSSKNTDISWFKYWLRFIFKHCVDCGNNSKIKVRGDVCSTCYNAFNGLTIEEIIQYKNNYILDADENPIIESDIKKWELWFQTADRLIAEDRIGVAYISTIFLGIDHSFNESHPLLYETMIFGGKHDQYTKRYYDKITALTGHKYAVKMIQ